jgi:predicted ABC-type ATPase
MTPPETPYIYVLAGVNGAGKSSIGGAAFRAFGADYYNPDEAARALMGANPGLSQSDANSAAWHQGKRLVEQAMARRLDFAFETTLGANTIPRLLAEAASQGIEVNVWYAGLSSPELHIERVRARVRKGGHDIPETDIRRRYQYSRLNLIHLRSGLYGCMTIARRPIQRPDRRLLRGCCCTWPRKNCRPGRLVANTGLGQADCRGGAEAASGLELDVTEDEIRLMAEIATEGIERATAQ